MPQPGNAWGTTRLLRARARKWVQPGARADNWTTGRPRLVERDARRGPGHIEGRRSRPDPLVRRKGRQVSGAPTREPTLPDGMLLPSRDRAARYAAPLSRRGAGSCECPDSLRGIALTANGTGRLRRPDSGRAGRAPSRMAIIARAASEAPSDGRPKGGGLRKAIATHGSGLCRRSICGRFGTDRRHSPQTKKKKKKKPGFLEHDGNLAQCRDSEYWGAGEATAPRDAIFDLLVAAGMFSRRA